MALASTFASGVVAGMEMGMGKAKGRAALDKGVYGGGGGAEAAGLQVGLFTPGLTLAVTRRVSPSLSGIAVEPWALVCPICAACAAWYEGGGLTEHPCGMGKRDGEEDDNRDEI